MGQSLAKVLVHLIFSTKQRRRYIASAVHDELAAYMAGVLRHWESPALQINCVEDHVHILFTLSRNYPLKKIVEEVKKSSSKWLKTKGPAYQGFAWQAGYGAFSVGQSHVNATRRYIASQEDHHRTSTFQDEFRRFLARYEIPCNEQFLWD